MDTKTVVDMPLRRGVARGILTVVSVSSKLSLLMDESVACQLSSVNGLKVAEILSPSSPLKSVKSESKRLTQIKIAANMKNDMELLSSDHSYIYFYMNMEDSMTEVIKYRSDRALIWGQLFFYF